MVEYVGTLGCVRQQDDVENIMYASIDVLESLGGFVHISIRITQKESGLIYNQNICDFCVLLYMMKERRSNKESRQDQCMNCIV